MAVDLQDFVVASKYRRRPVATRQRIRTHRRRFEAVVRKTATVRLTPVDDAVLDGDVILPALPVELPFDEGDLVRSFLPAARLQLRANDERLQPARRLRRRMRRLRRPSLGRRTGLSLEMERLISPVWRKSSG